MENRSGEARSMPLPENMRMTLTIAIVTYPTYGKNLREKIIRSVVY